MILLVEYEKNIKAVSDGNSQILARGDWTDTISSSSSFRDSSGLLFQHHGSLTFLDVRCVRHYEALPGIGRQRGIG